MIKKQVFRVIAFLLVMLVMFCFLSDVFENGPNRRTTTHVRTFYSLERDTLDVAFLGTSGIDRYWLAAKAYDERGLASYAMGINHLPAWIMLPIIKDIGRRQSNLKLLIIDMRPFTANYTGQGLGRYEERARMATEALPYFSLARLEGIDRTLETISENVEGESRFDLSYYFTFIKHHSRWTERDFNLYDEIEYKTSNYMGAFIHKFYSLRTMEEPATTYVTDERSPLDTVCMENLYELFDYLKEQDYEVLFLNTPHSHSKLEAKRINYLCDILDEKGFNYLNCSFDGKIYDLKNDLYNSTHFNYYGSEKFTKVFSDYLYEHYEFTDRRGDGRYYQWEGTYDNIKKTIAEWEVKK